MICVFCSALKFIFWNFCIPVFMFSFLLIPRLSQQPGCDSVTAPVPMPLLFLPQHVRWIFPSFISLGTVSNSTVRQTKAEKGQRVKRCALSLAIFLFPDLWPNKVQLQLEVWSLGKRFCFRRRWYEQQGRLVCFKTTWLVQQGMCKLQIREEYKLSVKCKQEWELIKPLSRCTLTE